MNAESVDSLKGRTVLVTGAGGFIGSHLTERLVRDGARVRAVCHYNSLGSAGWLDRISADVRREIDVQLGDILDPYYLETAMRDVDTVFHLAALIAIPYSYVAPSIVVETNVRGTTNVLDAARRVGVRRFVQTSTSEVYGTPDVVPITEDHPMKAQSPYAASKVAADQLSLAYHASFAVPVVVLRPFNTYGPRQSARAVLPAILTQLLAGRRSIKLGRLDTQRDLTFVSDTADGFVRAATTPDIEGQTIQLGTNRTITIGDLFALACKTVGVEATAETDERRVRPDKSEVLVLLSSPARAEKLLGWRPTTSLEDGVRQTADWLRAHIDRYHPDELFL